MLSEGFPFSMYYFSFYFQPYKILNKCKLHLYVDIKIKDYTFLIQDLLFIVNKKTSKIIYY